MRRPFNPALAESIAGNRDAAIRRAKSNIDVALGIPIVDSSKDAASSLEAEASRPVPRPATNEEMVAAYRSTLDERTRSELDLTVQLIASKGTGNAALAQQMPSGAVRFAVSSTTWGEPTWAAKPVDRNVRLEVFKGAEQVETIYLTSVPSIVMGRQRGAVDELIEDGSVSRQHCAIVNAEHATFLVDLDSAQGTYVHDGSTSAVSQLGDRMRPHVEVKLEENQTIRLGGNLTVFRIRGVRGPRVDQWRIPAWATEPTKPLQLVRSNAMKLDEEDAQANEAELSAPAIDISDMKAVLLGRSVDRCGVVVAHDTVSRLHAAIVHDEDHAFVVDLASTHGTFLDGVRLPDFKYSRYPQGARLRLGNCDLLYELRPAPSTEVKPPQKKFKG
mmetsp:Transcript_46904/g.77616  ORF Transcript_46904/g.77616 Transcript_46904/m.77616 type:complete len:388 (+) Transcript_46904:187-1350(+)